MQRRLRAERLADCRRLRRLWPLLLVGAACWHRPATAQEAVPPTEPNPAAPATPAPTPAEVREWIGQLAADRFDEREAALRRLEQAGVAAVGPLAEAALGDSLEATSRAVRALAAIARQGEIASFEQVQSSLERLADSKHKAAARRAAAALLGLREPRRKLALARIVELGAVLRPLSGARRLNLPVEDEFAAVQIILNRRWKGGDEGLVHLRRLEGLQQLYVTKGAGLSEEALAKLQEAVPGLQIAHRGDAMLGVSGGLVNGGVIIQTVAESSAAERAGLEEGDIILKYDGYALEDFEKLIEITRNHTAGDKVVLEVNRDGRMLTIEATLSEWE